MPAAAIKPEDWAKDFAYRLLELGTRAEPDMLLDLGLELHPTLGHLPPRQEPEAEFREWPPHDD